MDRFSRLMPVGTGDERSHATSFHDDQGVVYSLDERRGIAVRWPNKVVTAEWVERGWMAVKVNGLIIQIRVTEVEVDVSKLGRDLLESSPVDAATIPADAVRCPQCNGLMQKKINLNKHQFLGCNNFPTCKGSRPLCPDEGTCHHDCVKKCFRVGSCEPLSGVFPNDQWPVHIKKRHT